MIVIVSNPNPNGLSVLEIILAITSVIVAICSLIFTIYIFNYQTKKDSNSLKLDWYKSIIIDSKFNEFFSFFGDLKKLIDKIKFEEQFSDKDKEQLNDEIIYLFSVFRQEFISLLLAVDSMLYTCVLFQFDELVDGITKRLFNEGFDLEGNELKDELSNHLSTYKTTILQLFVNFKGENNSHLLNRIKVRYQEVFILACLINLQIF